MREWQQLEKDLSECIIQASAPEGDDSWQPFPIGMSWQIGYFFDRYRRYQKGHHEFDILCAISAKTDSERRPSSPNRQSFLATLLAKGIENLELDPETYYASLPHYKFVISPEGNGIDCHRHYEALLVGTIPIVEDRPEVREKYAGCPVLYTKDYSEITPAYLNEKYAEMIDMTYDFSRLFWRSYSPEEQFQLKYNGNSWMRRFFPRITVPYR